MKISYLERASDYEVRQWLEKENGTPLGAWLHGLNRSDFFFHVHAPPRGSWICNRDPMFVVSGPSFAVSWLEPLVLQWNYVIQIATLAATNIAKLRMEIDTVTCEEQKQLILTTLYTTTTISVAIAAPLMPIKLINHLFKKMTLSAIANDK